MSSDRREELLQWLADYCVGQLSDADAHRLADLLRSDANARRTFIEYVDLHSSLAWECSSIADLDLASQRADAASSKHQLKWHSALRRVVSTPQGLAVTVAGIVLALFLGALAFTPVPLLSRPSRDTHQPPDRIAAAEITNTVDCRWEESTLPLGHGSTLYKGQQVQLLEGSADIAFKSGAVATLTGPATFVVDTELKSTLRGGQIAVLVPKSALGFSVQTPAAVIVDKGTEFGVLVKPEGEEEVHVFQGLVDVSFPGSNVPARQLGSDDAVRIVTGADGIVVEELAASKREAFPLRSTQQGDTSIAESLPPEQHPPVTRGLTLWLAADGALRTDGDNHVVVWGDMTTGDNDRAQNATQHHRSYRPKLLPGAISGKPAIQFDGDDHMLLATPANFGILGRGYEIFIVARTSSPEIQFLIGGGVEDFEIHLNGDSGARFIPAGYAAGAGASDLRASGAFANGRPHIFSARVDPNGARQGVLVVDGEDSSDLTAGDARGVNNTSLRLGMRHDGSFGLRGEIAEVLIFRGQLTEAQRRSISRYLAEKYHVLIRAQPN